MTTARRTPDPGTNGGFCYSDTCANCKEPIRGELIGILADGPHYSWRHRNGFASGCGGRVDWRAPQAIPPAEAEAECTVHGKVTRYHGECEAGGKVTPLSPNAG